MRKLHRLVAFTAILLLYINFSFPPTAPGVYVQLHPDNNKKIIIQILPDKTYADVVAYVNFYSADNKRVAQKAFSLSEGKEKYVRKGKCTTKTFKFSFDKAIARVTIDHLNEGEILTNDDAAKGVKLTLPVSAQPLVPIQE